MKKLTTFGTVLLSSIIISAAAETTFFTAHTTEAGKLADVIGELRHEIDSLIVEGPINDADINTLWEETFYGKTSVLNLKNAKVEGNRIPGYAFWHQDVQLEPGGGYFTTTNLRHIILPDGVQEIGDHAFMYSRRLEEVELPSSLSKLGEAAFYECTYLKTSPLVFPDALEVIDRMCFYGCRRLDGIVLPEQMERIGYGAFWGAWIKSAEMPSEVEQIDDYAFYGSRLKEAMLPKCNRLGEYIFGHNMELERLEIADGVTDIPKGVADNCLALKEIKIAPSVGTICDEAFCMCISLTEMHLPEGVMHVKDNVFKECGKLEVISYPSTTASISVSTLRHPSLKSIYCQATIPPVLGINGTSTELSDIPVYVPTGTADEYRDVPGWDYFTNIIETDEFPGTSGVSSIHTDRTSVSTTPGGVIIETSSDPVDFRIITSDGRTAAAGQAIGSTTVTLFPGIYIITTGGTSHKICVK